MVTTLIPLYIHIYYTNTQKNSVTDRPKCIRKRKADTCHVVTDISIKGGKGHQNTTTVILNLKPKCSQKSKCTPREKTQRQCSACSSSEQSTPNETCQMKQKTGK